jgi:hypothetical protein
MSRFWSDAERVLEIAGHIGEGASEMAILTDPGGSLRIVMEQGWSAEGLRAHFGGEAVYQVKRTPRGIRVEGHGPGRTCTLGVRGFGYGA